MPQLAMMTSGSGLPLNFRCPYQANVMKTLEANSIRIGNSDGEMAGIEILLQQHTATIGSGTGFPDCRLAFVSRNAKAWHDRSSTT
jgi:hypothetical protein